LEIYADTLMQERGFEEGSQTSPEILDEPKQEKQSRKKTNRK
jgi:hypothetical protein